MIAPANDSTRAVSHNGADQGIGRTAPPTAQRLPEGQPHHLLVIKITGRHQALFSILSCRPFPNGRVKSQTSVAGVLPPLGGGLGSERRPLRSRSQFNHHQNQVQRRHAPLHQPIRRPAWRQAISCQILNHAIAPESAFHADENMVFGMMLQMLKIANDDHFPTAAWVAGDI